jgi:hypothetical protein
MISSVNSQSWTLLLVATAFSMSAAAESAVVDGKYIHNVIPQGYCPIGDGARRSAMAETAQAITGDSGSVISVFESCPKNQNAASAAKESSLRFGWVVVGRANGKTVLAPGSTRAQYLAAVDSLMRKEFPSAPHDPDKRLKAARSSKVPVNENWGVIGRDSNAVYQSAMGTLGTDGKRVTLGVFVTGSTFSNRQSFSNFLYEVVNDDTSVAGLLLEQQKIMASFIKDNELDNTRD